MHTHKHTCTHEVGTSYIIIIVSILCGSCHDVLQKDLQMMRTANMHIDETRINMLT